MSGAAHNVSEGLGEGLYKALFDHAVVGLTLTDGERHILECNDAYCELVGRSREDVLGRSARDFDPPGQPDITGPPMDALARGDVESYRAEKQYLRPDGTLVSVRVTSSVISRELDRYVTIIEDLSAVVDARDELRDQRALLERAQEVGGVGSWIWYPGEDRVIWSEQALRIFGLEDGASFVDAIHPDDRERVRALAMRAYEQGTPVSTEFRFIRPNDAQLRWFHGQAVLEGERVLGAITDITDARRAEEELRRQSALLDHSQQIGTVGSWVWDAVRNAVTWSSVARRIYGLTDEQAATGDPDLFWDVVIHPDDRETVKSGNHEALEANQPYEAEYRVVRPGGEVAWVHARSEVEVGPAGVQQQIGVVVDLTPSIVASAELSEQKALLERAQEVGGVGSWAWYAHEDRNVWSTQARRILGLPDEVGDEEDPLLFFSLVHPDDRGRRNTQTFLGADEPRTLEYRIVRHSDRAVRWVRETGVLERTANGQPFRLLGAIADITQYKVTTDALAEQSEALKRAHELAGLGRFTIDITGRLVIFSDEVARLLGAPASEGAHDIDAFREQFIHPDDVAGWSRSAEEAYTREGPFAWDSRMRRGDGDVIWVRIHGRTEVDADGAPLRAVGVIQDVTEQHRLEEQLLQAQKLEAVGQLAGGVAHDFNNLLTVIVGNAELALSTANQSGADFPTDDMEEILRAATRAGDLVKQLLAFSRSDAAQPRVIDLNAAVQGIRRMLMRLLEENIRVQATLIEAATPILVDPGQLEQVLLNLAVNARDAMPEGGRLTISTEADHKFVTLRVADTGIGMDDQVRARIFDPFYTTKAPGEGTGLGLSTVYGIVTKVGGTIEVESERGGGTTFTVRFPRASALLDVLPVEPDAAAPGAGERVLIVEDDDMVRGVSALILERAGYDVVTATNGQEALDLFDVAHPFDLMVTDLMMPTMTGIQLAEELGRRGVDLPVVYTSGYAEGVTDHTPEGANTAFLPKPFSGGDLSTAVRQLLDTEFRG